ncbi:MAG: dihydroorotase family protein [Candidatus Thorarchaeota archaeon]
MTIDLNIVNGKLFLPDGFRQGGISIEGEKIVRIGKEYSLPKSSSTINANGALILPGLIDIHVHLRDFEQNYKETLVTGTRSAVSGGVTTVLDMPNNKPPTNSVNRIENKFNLIREKTAANIGFYSLLPQKIEQMEELVAKGIFGFKMYPADILYPPKNDQTLAKFLKFLPRNDVPLVVHPDNGFAAEAEKELFESEMPKIDAFFSAHNQIEEAKALDRFISLQTDLSFKLHCAHVTAKETINILQEHAKDSSLSSEVCPHHLMLTKEDLFKLGSQAKCLPPLRTKEDQNALWQALDDNLIKVIATDHAPHSYNEKFCDFEYAASGIHGLETLAPVMFTQVTKGKITFEKLIPKMTANPAKLMGIEKRGELKEGYFADILILKKEKGQIEPDTFESKAKWTPFQGFQYTHRPWKVLVNGSLAKEDEFVISKTRSGKILEKTY